MILLGFEEAGADEACDAEEFGAYGKADEGETHPQESSLPRACISEAEDTAEPLDPEHHGIPLFLLF